MAPRISCAPTVAGISRTIEKAAATSHALRRLLISLMVFLPKSQDRVRERGDTTLYEKSSVKDLGWIGH
jgi:hypothetical protein